MWLGGQVPLVPKTNQKTPKSIKKVPSSSKHFNRLSHGMVTHGQTQCFLVSDAPPTGRRLLGLPGLLRSTSWESCSCEGCPAVHEGPLAASTAACLTPCAPRRGHAGSGWSSGLQEAEHKTWNTEDASGLRELLPGRSIGVELLGPAGQEAPCPQRGGPLTRKGVIQSQ